MFRGRSIASYFVHVRSRVSTASTSQAEKDWKLVVAICECPGPTTNWPNPWQNFESDTMDMWWKWVRYVDNMYEYVTYLYIQDRLERNDTIMTLWGCVPTSFLLLFTPSFINPLCLFDQGRRNPSWRHRSTSAIRSLRVRVSHPFVVWGDFATNAYRKIYHLPGTQP